MRGHRDGLADARVREPLRAGAGELGRVVERADADDASLALHEARHRVHGADAAWVRERDGRAGEVAGLELVRAGLLDDRLVGGHELGEVHRLARLDARHEQRARAVGLRHVDRDAEVDVRRRDEGGLAVDLVVVDVLAREQLERLHERVADDVRERDLAAARAAEVVVDDDALIDHQLRGHGAHARRGGDGERLVHVGGERLRHAAQRRDDGLLGGLLGLRRLLRRGGGGIGGHRRGSRGLRGGAGDDRAVGASGGGRVGLALRLLLRRILRVLALAGVDGPVGSRLGAHGRAGRGGALRGCRLRGGGVLRRLLRRRLLRGRLLRRCLLRGCLLRLRRRRRLRGRRRRRRAHARRRVTGGALGRVPLEDGPPRLGDGRLVLAEELVLLLDEPLVRSEVVVVRRAGHGIDRLFRNHAGTPQAVCGDIALQHSRVRWRCRPCGRRPLSASGRARRGRRRPPARRAA